MEDVEIILQKAIALNNEKKWEKVIELLDDSLLENYNNFNLYAEKAQSLWFLKKYLECEKNAEKSLQISANAKAYNYRGNIFYKNKDYVKAESFYKKAISFDSNYQAPYYGLGAVFRAKRKFNLAELYYKKALKIDHNNSVPYNGLGNLYLDLKDILIAEKYFKLAIEKDPNFSLPYNGLGNVAERKKEYESAIKYYKKAIKLDKTTSTPYYNLGRIYGFLNEYNLAEEFFLKAIELNESHASGYNGLANLLKRTGKLKESEEYYKRAIKADPLCDVPYYNLGILYNDQNNIKEAKKYFEKYLSLTDDNDDDFIHKNALSKIDEINKKTENSSYKKISKIIDEIKELLLFEEECITHYTSITTVQLLLLKESPFRLSEGTFLNDTSEGDELFKFLGLSNGSIESNNAEIYTKRPFIGSFVDSSKSNDLTLWRMYGKEGLEEAKGCSITLNIKEFKTEINNINKREEIDASSNTDIEFYRVIYRNGEEFCFSGATEEINISLTSLMNDLKLEVSKFFKKSNTKNDELEIIELLNSIAYLFKSVEYQYENEIRLVINENVGFEKKIDFNESNFIPSKTPIKVYIELIPVAPLLKRITIGPKVERGEEWASTFHYVLSNKELKSEIYISNLPFK